MGGPTDIWQAIIVALISGGVGAALIKIIGDSLSWRRERKAKKEDRESLNISNRLESIEKKTDLQSEALRYMLYDRIRYLGLAYIDEGEISFDDRKILRDMHKSYHYGLHGNGDLDNLMNAIDNLPLKKSNTN